MAKMLICCGAEEPSGTNWMRRYEKWGIVKNDSEVSGFGCELWNIENVGKLADKPKNGAKTLLEILEASCQKYSGCNAVGWRNVVKVHMVPDEGGVPREKIQLENRYNWMKYSEYLQRVKDLGSGMAQIGVNKGSNMVIYAETQKDWMVSAFAAFYNSATVVTIYATLGEDGAQYGINQTKATTIVADAKLLKIVAKILPKCPSVKTVIAMRDDHGLGSSVGAVKVFSIDQVIAMGQKESSRKVPPSPEDTAIIMYTSGTTGNPKGVMITHANGAAAAAACENVFAGCMSPTDIYMGYLPLAHIMEMLGELAVFCQGAAIGFGSPHTLTDTGVKLKRPESMGDAPLLKPTSMVFAPAVLDKVYKGVQAKFADLKPPIKKLADWGLQSAYANFDNQVIGASSIYNIVFKKVRALIGGQLRACITGSAPLSPDIQKFVQGVFGAPVRQGYGLTETCAASCVQFWGDSTTLSVGPPTSGAVIRLADWPEGNYQNSDKDNKDIGMRRGEVLIGGHMVTKGYYIDPTNPDPELVQKNQEDWVSIYGIRFFRTGDIGQIKPDGTLSIIDRKKDLWKGPNGEYVALTKVEAALKMCEYVEMPMCYGKTGKEYPVALVCPLKPKILALAASQGNASTDFQALCEDPKIKEVVVKACSDSCKKSKLLEFETPKKIGLITDLWTPENDMLTAAMKLKRPLIVQKHKFDIDQLYGA
eukprot:gnl/TRDRNA2_/TRDRNA2_136774_c0_seq2.p1 gnl/TRDRNA2_/TRDRNA2_136774_c0~~gnl/TRDRNA2_/TRDRNA2_136774_c0_seq2.p1  ORF type:complete len:705 (-),score=162.24 gnl/TRDRNA2_/TRDRNA2_136774_c0_seq2:367-2481(-)